MKVGIVGTEQYSSSTDKIRTQSNTTKEALHLTFGGSDSSTSSISSSLQRMKEAFSASAARMSNAVAAFEKAKEGLNRLIDITKELIGLAEEASSGYTDVVSRSQLDARFRSLTREFESVRRETSEEGYDLFDKEDLEALLNDLGVDTGAATELAQTFRKIADYDHSLGHSFVEGEDKSIDTWTKKRVTTYSYEYFPPDPATYHNPPEGGGYEGTRPSGETVMATGFPPDPFFQTRQVIPGGTAPCSLDAGDVDNDGDLDIVVADLAGGASAAIRLYIGNGDGTFKSAQVFEGSAGTFDVKLVDYNDDGNLDLIATDRDEHTISYYKGYGSSSGTFETRKTFWSGYNPQYIASGDFDEDGDPDITITEGSSSGIHILFADGDTFTASNWIHPEQTYGELAVKDFNNDGNLDMLAVDTTNNTVQYWFGWGTGEFTDGGTYDVGAGAQRLNVADVNGDGFLDFVTDSGAGSEVYVGLGNGDGTFQAVRTFDSSTGPQSIDFMDYNLDGNLDIVTVSQTDGQVNILLGNGDGNFSAPLSFNVGGTARDMALGDFDGDGLLDLATLSDDLNELQIYLNNVTTSSSGTPLFGNPTMSDVAGPERIEVGDLNNDGVLDAVTLNPAHPSYNYVGLMYGNSDGSFQATRYLEVSGYSTPNGLALADVDSDNYLDFAVTWYDDQRLTIHTSNGNGTFAVDSDINLGATPGGLTSADFNKDGTPDFAVTLEDSDQVVFYSGDGTALGSAAAVGAAPGAITYGDFDADGNVDLIVANTGDDTVSILLGNGNGTFRAAINSYAGHGLSSIAVGDFNEDGNLDAALTNATDNTVTILMGNGDGTFAGRESAPLSEDPWFFRSVFDTGESPSSVRVADFDGDDHLDLIVSERDAGTVSVLYGNGDGTFEARYTFAAGIDVSDVAVGDIDNDNAPDIYVSNFISNTVGTYINNSDFTIKGGPYFQDYMVSDAGVAPWRISSADLDEDENVDLAVVDSDSNEVNILYGNGDGTFADFEMLTGNARSVLLSDVDADDNIDIVVSKLDGWTHIYYGNGDGSFDAVSSFYTGNTSDQMVAADFDGDGYIDIAGAGDDLVTVLFGNANGTFDPVRSLALPGSPATGLDYADLDSDGNLDLVIREKSGDVQVLMGAGDRSFDAAVQYDLAASSNGESISLADINNDGNLDIVTPNLTGSSIEILYGNGDGTFGAATSLAAAGALWAEAEDLDGDGNVDIVLSGTGGSLGLLRGNGDGTFDALYTFATGNGPIRFVLDDFDNDYATDVATVNESGAVGETLSVLLSNDEVHIGGGDLFEDQQVFSTWPGGTTARGGVTADFNGDGNLDALMYYSTANAQVFLGNGDMTFSPQTMGDLAEPALAMAAADVDGDGNVDLLTLDETSNTFSVYLGNGNGTFRAQDVQGALGIIPESITLGDFYDDGNGNLDVMISGATGADESRILIFRGDNDGTFTLENTVNTAGSGPGKAAAGDFDNDGNLDYAQIKADTGEIAVGLGNSDATFDADTLWGVGGEITSVTAGDLDGDNDDEIIVTDAYSSTVKVLLSNGDGKFEAAVSYAVSINPSHVTLMDHDGDGIADIVVSAYGDNVVDVLIGNGDGTFQPRASFAVGNDPVEALVGDFDGNNTEDLVVVNSGHNSISALENETRVKVDEETTKVDAEVVEFASAPRDPLDNTITSRAGGLVAANQLERLLKDIKKDLEGVEKVLKQLEGAQRFALQAYGATEELESKLNSFTDAQELAIEIARRIKNTSKDNALGSFANIDTLLAQELLSQS